MNKIPPFLIPMALLLTGCVSMTAPPSPEPPRGGWNKGGEVTVEHRFWNWFFQPSREQRIEILTDKAQEQAEVLYGTEARLTILSMEGQWSPLSLLLGVDLLGFVEDAQLTAAVWIPVEEPISPPLTEEKPRRKITYRYPVVPEAFYNSPGEYTEVEYKSRAIMTEDLRTQHAEGKIHQEDMVDRLAELPPGGAVYVSFGRREIKNAISKWFTFHLTQGDITIFSRQGWDDIPYVPGGDGLWWNDLILPLEKVAEPPFNLEIQDRFQEKVYRFTILKETEIIYR